MKLWEVIKALEENPCKAFTSNHMGKRHVIKADKNGYLNLEIYAGTGELISQKSGGGAFNGNIHISKMDWQALVIPVTWQEAIEAWANGDTVKCVLGRSESVFLGEKIAFRNQDASVVDKAQIRDGKWYIED